MITIVDYGLSNIGSLRNMFARLHVETCVVSTAGGVMQAAKLLLPGVGHFGTAMKELKSRDLIGALTDKVMGERIPTLGICLGMQLLGRFSEEGEAEGLGWLPAAARRFRWPDAAAERKIPNMGWRAITVRQPSPLFPDPERPRRFYFVHGYHLVCDDPADVLATAHYGMDFTAGVMRGNLFGTQFHPEKSHRFGMDLLAEFARV